MQFCDPERYRSPHQRSRSVGRGGSLSAARNVRICAMGSQEQELWLARDPYGIKPRYVSESNGSMWFASQARALANCVPVNTRREVAALVGLYLWGTYQSLFLGGRASPCSGWSCATNQNRSADNRSATVRQRSGDLRSTDYGAERIDLRGLLAETVRHHMVSDVDRDRKSG